jgi:hypothetical protein
MMTSSHGRYVTKFQSRLYQNFRNEQNDLNINTCVPVLVELLKEKDAEIVKLRNEIDEVGKIITFLLHPFIFNIMHEEEYSQRQKLISRNGKSFM